MHIPDTFGDPSHFTAHGPLTPADGSVKGSCLQASRGYNSVVYGWRDDTGGVYVGVSKDGRIFPPAKLLIRDKDVVNGPATAIYGDYVSAVYLTSNSAFAPQSHARNRHDEYYYAWCESGDGGEHWSQPAALIQDVKRLPIAIGYSVGHDNDLRRSEVPLSGATTRFGSLQMPAWPASVIDSRLFVEMAITPLAGPGGEDWRGPDNNVGLLAWKPIDVGGIWRYVLTNRSLFRRTALANQYDGRLGAQYKYCALPGTAVRVVAYVDRAERPPGQAPPTRPRLEDHIVLLMSTNMGDSFDYETAFSASQLQLEPDAEIVIANSLCSYVDEEGNIWQDLLFGDARRPHLIQPARLPTGINVQGFDPTSHW